MQREGIHQDDGQREVLPLESGLFLNQALDDRRKLDEQVDLRDVIGKRFDLCPKDPRERWRYGCPADLASH